MPTAPEVDALEQEMQAVATLAVASLVEQWTDLPAEPLEAVDVARELALALVDQYGQTNAAAALDWYQSVRPPASPSFTPTPQPVRTDLIEGGTLNWMTKPLVAEPAEVNVVTPLEPGRDEALDRIAESIMLGVREAAIEAIGEATDEDPLDARFARFPQSPTPCAWCVLRASRGALYWSEEAATRGDHRDCRCKVTAVFPGEVLPYLRAPYIAQYQNGADAARDATAAIRADRTLTPAQRQKAIRSALLAGMRQANGSR